jgi:hypothetical protein
MNASEWSLYSYFSITILVSHSFHVKKEVHGFEMMFETREHFNYLIIINLAVDNIHILSTYTFSYRFRSLDSERVILDRLSLYFCLLGAMGCKQSAAPPTQCSEGTGL